MGIQAWGILWNSVHPDNLQHKYIYECQVANSNQPLFKTLNIWQVGSTHTQNIFQNFIRSIQIMVDCHDLKKHRHVFSKEECIKSRNKSDYTRLDLFVLVLQPHLNSWKWWGKVRRGTRTWSHLYFTIFTVPFWKQC